MHGPAAHDEEEPCVPRTETTLTFYPDQSIFAEKDMAIVKGLLEFSSCRMIVFGKK